MTSHFHIITIPDPVLELSLLAFRHMVDPTHTSVPHVTVGGPYETYQPPPKCPEEGYEIGLNATIGTFHNPRFHVAYLRVDAPHLKEVWHKPEFDTFIPHLTLYSGPDQRVVEKIETLFEHTKGKETEFPFKFRIFSIENHRKLTKATKEEELHVLRNIVGDHVDFPPSVVRISTWIINTLSQEHKNDQH